MFFTDSILPPEPEGLEILHDRGIAFALIARPAIAC